TAYIQIKYQGSANQFGWLVPVPSVPTLELGTDEVFDQLSSTTQPTYRLTTTRNYCGGGSSSSSSALGGCGADSVNTPSFGGASDAGTISDMGSAGEVVTQSSIGPFDYAVLHADSQSEMLAWLQANQYY